MSVLTAELLASFDESIRPVSEAKTLPPVVYTSEEFLDFERRALFDHEWLCVGRASSVPEPGDWFSVTINGEPLLVVRGKDGQVRALSAVCQHRGMQVAEGSGNTGTFTCPYHRWIYGLDGRLLGAPAMERTEDFDKKCYGLPNVRVELWQGFVFVNFDPDAPALTPTLTRYEPFLAHYELDRAVCPGTFTLRDLPWNWKVMFENFNDGYHANRLHRIIQDFCPSELAAFPVPWDDASNVIFRTNGYIHIDGGFNPTSKALMPIYPMLTEEERWRSTFALVPPTLCLGTAPDQVFFFLVRPKTACTIDVEIGYLFHPSALEHPMFDKLFAMSDAGVQVFVKQDQDATTKVQRGMKSRFAARGRYSWQEESHVQFNRWLVQRYHRHWPAPSEAVT
ncbi:MAG TPA: aromatic ring-hydroxylating dioxygenase subunit alpha [Acidimicrobiales bacterium]|jgi:phenylpropionate dioxygenase-like ring-hydroxylating dioxygenase large terminal subunit|nr:aromatic ring-hydroxylating dioxygenase subunit alpha [Acidimicrobiales bacterium]